MSLNNGKTFVTKKEKAKNPLEYLILASESESVARSHGIDRSSTASQAMQVYFRVQLGSAEIEKNHANETKYYNQ